MSRISPRKCKHYDAIDEHGMILAVHTTTTNEHDFKGLEPLLKKIPKRHKKQGVWADKGYKVPSITNCLKKKKLRIA